MGMKKANKKADGPSHEELVLNLVRAMKQEGLTIEAADAPGFPKPPQMKRFGLRASRSRPDVIGRDGRRTIFGEAKLGSEIGESYVPDQLESFASKCRLLVVCIPKEAADEAIDTLFDKAHIPHSARIRLLTYPETKWRDLPRRPAKKGRAQLDFPKVEIDRAS
jgi:hypothetical protein